MKAAKNQKSTWAIRYSTDQEKVWAWAAADLLSTVVADDRSRADTQAGTKRTSSCDGKNTSFCVPRCSLVVLKLKKERLFRPTKASGRGEYPTSRPLATAIR